MLSLKRERLYCTFLLLFFTVFNSFSQDTTLYNWEVTSKKITDNSFELTFTTPGNPNWQLYGANEVVADVPATTIEVDSSIVVRTPFKESGSSTQISSAIFDNAKFNVYEGRAVFTAIIEVKGTVPATLLGKLNYTYGKGDEFYPNNQFTFSVPLEGGKQSETRIKISSIDLENPASDCGDEDTGGKSLLGIFLLGLLGGFIALLTPCVFPLIPLTVSFFTKKTTRRRTIKKRLLCRNCSLIKQTGIALIGHFFGIVE